MIAKTTTANTGALGVLRNHGATLTADDTSGQVGGSFALKGRTGPAGIRVDICVTHAHTFTMGAKRDPRIEVSLGEQACREPTEGVWSRGESS